jgi:hypothetical protein
MWTDRPASRGAPRVKTSLNWPSGQASKTNSAVAQCATRATEP